MSKYQQEQKLDYVNRQTSFTRTPRIKNGSSNYMETSEKKVLPHYMAPTIGHIKKGDDSIPVEPVDL